MCDIVSENPLKEQPSKEMKIGKKDSGSIERVHKSFGKISVVL